MINRLTLSKKWSNPFFLSHQTLMFSSHHLLWRVSCCSCWCCCSWSCHFSLQTFPLRFFLNVLFGKPCSCLRDATFGELGTCGGWYRRLLATWWWSTVIRQRLHHTKSFTIKLYLKKTPRVRQIYNVSSFRDTSRQWCLSQRGKGLGYNIENIPLIYFSNYGVSMRDYSDLNRNWVQVCMPKIRVQT